MGRKVTCQICKSKIDSDIAYKLVHVSKSGNKTNKYYCSENEYRQKESDTFFWKQCQLGIDSILGYTCINNSKNKMLGEILDSGYTREQLFDCIKDQHEYISECLSFRDDIETEYSKLCYIFKILSSTIKDITKSNELSNLSNEYNIKDIPIAKINVPAEEIKPKRKSLKDRLKEKHHEGNI